ncbi:MAG: hypothetical protein ABI432_00825 [Flavobacteriales bacterium]
MEPVRYVWGGTPSPDGHLMLLDVSDLDAKKDRGPSDLWIVQRTDTGWTEPRKLPPSIKSADQYENFVAFTPDGKTVVFVREFATYNEVSVGDLLRDP